MDRNKKLAAAVACAVFGMTAPVRAIDGAGVTNNNNASIGQVFDLGALNGTGTLISNGTNLDPDLVLTCGHLVDTSAPSTNGATSSIALFNRFSLPSAGQTNQVAALGVQCPTYNPALQQNDIGVMFLLGPITGGNTLSIVTNAANLTPGTSTVTAVGYGSETQLVNPARQATLTLSTNTATLYQYTTTNFAGVNNINTAWLQPGDSGGPSISGTNNRVVGVHATRQIVPGSSPPVVRFSTDTRVDAFTSFLQGDGIGGQLAFDRLSASAPQNANWSDTASWARGSAGSATVPNATDVVILKAPGGSMSIDVNTANLEGLINNVPINDTSGRTLSITGLSGLLNGNTITVNNNSRMDVAYTIDNVGTIAVGGNGIVTAAADVRNNAGATMTIGGAAGQPAQMTIPNLVNQGTMTVNGTGTVNITMSRPVQGSLNVCLNNLGNITVNAGGQMNLTNGVVNRGGSITVKGTVTAAATNSTPVRPQVANYGGRFRLDPTTASFSNTDFYLDPTSSLGGQGTMQFLGSGDYINQATLSGAPDFDTRQLNFVYLGATSAIESSAASPFTGGPFGLSDPMSIQNLTLNGASLVKLTNNDINQISQGSTMPDVMFTRTIYIEPGSQLDLANTDLWVNGNDVSQLTGYIASSGIIDSAGPGALSAVYYPQYDATLIAHVPEPASLGAIAVGFLGFMRRRRR